MTSGNRLINRKRTGHSTFRFQADIYLARFCPFPIPIPHSLITSRHSVRAHQFTVQKFATARSHVSHVLTRTAPPRSTTYRIKVARFFSSHISTDQFLFFEFCVFTLRQRVRMHGCPTTGAASSLQRDLGNRLELCVCRWRCSAQPLFVSVHCIRMSVWL